MIRTIRRKPKTSGHRKGIVFVLALSACGLSRSDSVPGDVAETRSSALFAASQTLSAALNGRIVEPVSAGGTIRASTPGTLQVNHDGSTSYSVPLWVPDGVVGLQPSLRVQYNSNAGTGLLGKGWNLSGLSKITRCAPTLAQDGHQGTIEYWGDTFCMDGVRLIRTSYPSANPLEFRTEKNPFTKIEMTFAGGIPQFQAWHPNGQILSFGTSQQSRLHGTPYKPDQTGPGSDSILTWYLDSVSDRYQNVMTITYGNTTTSPTSMAIELAPQTIAYGGRTVEFYYNSAISDSAHTQWINGLGIVSAGLLNEVVMRGPGSTGGTTVLRSYRFGYNPPTATTGATLLSTIKECDARGGNAVCKQPTSITWESGSLQYGAGRDLGVSEAAKTIRDINNADVSVVLQRIIPVDLNRDGLDDIIYRKPLATGNCVGWYAKLAAWNTPTVTYGASVPLGLNDAYADPSCGTQGGFSQAYPGDVIIADLNSDGFPDILSPVGNHVSGSSTLNGYRVYFNSALADLTTFGFGSPLPFEDASLVPLQLAAISIGDVNGDGIPEVLRQHTAGNGALWGAAVAPSGATTPVAVPHVAFSDGGTSVPSGFMVLDMDGDGAVEILRDSSLGHVTASSQTIAAQLANFPGVIPGQPPSADRWILDLNGDGLPDVAWVTGSAPTQIHALINTGVSFINPTDTPLPNGFQVGGAWTKNAEDGVRVVDFNEDGRQDLLLVDNAAGTNQMRMTAVVLLSNGNGGFTASNTFIPLGDPSDGTYNLASPYHGYRTTVVLDANGDGLPDVLQNQGGHLYLYQRQGKMADMVTGVLEGTGREAIVTYSSLADPNVYSLDPTTCASDREHLDCVTHAWVTSQAQMRGGGELDDRKQYTYANGVADKKGRGFLGFTRRDIFDPWSSKHTEIDFNPTWRMELTASSYVYPYAFMPVFTQDDANTWDATENFYYHQKSYAYGPTVNSNGTFRFDSLELSDIVAECLIGATDSSSAAIRAASRTTSNSAAINTLPTRRNPVQFGAPPVRQPSSTKKPPAPRLARRASPSGTAVSSQFTASKVTAQTVVSQPLSSSFTNTSDCSIMDTLKNTYEFFSYDGYGNLTAHSLTAFDNSGGTIEQDSDTLTYLPANEATWLVSQLSSSQRWSYTPSFPARTRTTSYVPNPTTGDLDSFTIEPSGSTDVKMTRTFTRDPMSGRLTRVTDSDSYGNMRPTIYDYNTANDGGVYPWKITNAVGHTTTIWRHPGLGYVVEVDDPNNLAAVTKYDTFGRIWSQTAISGETLTMAYNDVGTPPSNGGVDFTISPQGFPTRAVSIHLNPFGQETRRARSVDAEKQLSTTHTYDNWGRLSLTEDDSITGSTLTVLNYHSFSYDPLDRPVADCHLVSDGGEWCSLTYYDWNTVTKYDEAGRWTMTTFDGLGRTGWQATNDANQTYTATAFAYGPFGQLTSVSSDDANATTTTFAYDIRGRLAGRWHMENMFSSDTGSYHYSHNAFGEVEHTYHSGGPFDDGVWYSYDDIGRVRWMGGAGLDRTFYWDTNATGDPAPYGKGHIIDVNENENGVRIHYDYANNGLLMSKAWTFPALGETYTEGFGYTSQGELASVVYPLMPGDSSPFEVFYNYDDYTGTVRRITATSNPSTPIWEAGARNEWGSITSETLKFQSTALTRTASYYQPDNRPNTMSLSNGAATASLTYTYHQDGLPQTLTTTTPTTASRTESFDYDNLGQLTSWRPDTGAPVVTYGYDHVGRLTSRSWTGSSASETVSYNAFANSYSAWTVQVNNLPPQVYNHDAWGRATSTPALTSIGYNANDEVTSLVEASNGQTDTIIRDPFGDRVITLYGSSGSAGSLITLDDMYELKRVGSTTEGRCRLRADGRIVGDIVRTNGGARTATFYLANATGTIVAEASSATGAVVGRAARDPFGNLLSNPQTPFLPSEPTGTNPDGSSRLGYGDHEHDPNWGVVDMVARLYSPRLGRFMSPDSIIQDRFDRRDYNPFAYVHNNPIRNFDPDGHGVKVDDPPNLGSVTYVIGGSAELPQPSGGVVVPIGFGSGPIGPGTGGGSGATGGGTASQNAKGTSGSKSSSSPVNMRVPTTMGVAQSASTSPATSESKQSRWELEKDDEFGDAYTCVANCPVYEGGTKAARPSVEAATTMPWWWLFGGGGAVGAGGRAVNILVKPNPILIIVGILLKPSQIRPDDFPPTQEMASQPKAPGVPTEADGFKPAKGWDGVSTVPVPSEGRGARDKGYPADDGGIWVPTGEDPSKAHGGPHWDVQYPGGKYDNVYPGGGRRGGNRK